MRFLEKIVAKYLVERNLVVGGLNGTFKTRVRLEKEVQVPPTRGSTVDNNPIERISGAVCLPFLRGVASVVSLAKNNDRNFRYASFGLVWRGC
jgi:hypothetical protein